MNISKNHAINSGFLFGLFQKLKPIFGKNQDIFSLKLNKICKTQPFGKFSLNFNTLNKIQMLKLHCQDTSQKNCLKTELFKRTQQFFTQKLNDFSPKTQEF